MKKKLRLIIYPFVFLLLLAAGGGYYFLHTQLALHLVVTSLRQAAANVFGSELKADGWQGDLLQGLTVTNLSVQAEGRQWLAIKKIELKFDPFPLLVGLLHIKSVVLVRPDLSLSTDASGKILMPMKARHGTSLRGLGWPGLGRVDRFAVKQGAVHWYDDKGEKIRSRDCNGLSLTGKAGFYVLPGLKKWSAWLSDSAGSFHLVPNNLDITLTASRIVLQTDRFEGRGLHLSAGKSDARFDFVLPYDRTRAMSLRWHDARLALRELGLDSKQQIETSGSLVSMPPPPELSSLRSSMVRLQPNVYKLEQTLQLAKHRFTMEGRLARPFSGSSAFQGSVLFKGMDTTAVASLLSGFNMTAAAEEIRRMKQFSKLAGSLYLDTKREPEGRKWRGTFNLHEGMLGGVRLRQVELPFKLSGSTLKVESGLINTDQGVFSGNLSCFLGTSGPLLAAQGKIENYRPVLSQAGILAGEHLAAKAELTLDHEGKLTFHGKLEPMRIDGHQLVGGHFAGSSQGDVTTLKELSVTLDGGTISVSGEKEKDSLALAFQLKQFPQQLLFKEATGILSGSGTLEKSPGTAYQLSLDLPEMQSGELKISNLHIIFPFSPNRLDTKEEHFQLHAGQGSWRKMQFADLKVEGNRKGKEFAVDTASILFAQENWRLVRPADFLLDGADFSLPDLELASAQGMISASLQRQMEKVSSRVKVEGMRIPKGLPFPLLGDFKTVLYDLDLTIEGPLAKPGITFSGKVYGPESDRKLNVSLAGEFDDNQLHVNAVTHVAGQAIPMKLELPMQLSLAPFSLHFDLDRLVAATSLSAGKLADFPFLAAYGCKGSFQFAMTMREKSEQTQWLTGRLHLEDAGCRLPDTDLTLEDGDLFFHGEKNRIVLDPSKIRSNQGELLLQGAVDDLKKYPSFSGTLNVSSDAIKVNYKGIYKISLTGSLTAALKKGRRSLQGDLTVLSADLKQPMHAAGFGRSDNTVIYESRSAPEGVRRDDLLAGLERLICGTSLDVRINLPKNVVLHAGALSLQLEGDLHAGGDGKGLVLEGHLAAVGGSYSVAGREFKVEEGEVTFSRKNGLDPALEGKAVCRMPDLVVTARVKGTAENPLVSLESDPWMKENEIKSAIVFGKPVADLSARQKNQFDTSVATLLGGTVLNRFNAMTGNQTLLDSFSFYSDRQSGNESIAVGKYLTDDLLFSYRQGGKQSNAGEVRVEYKLKGGFSLESLYSEEGQKSGFDFFWSKDF